MNSWKHILVALALGAAASSQAQNLVKNGNFDEVVNANGVAQPATDNYAIATTLMPWGFDLPSWTNNSMVAVVYGSGLGDSGNNFPLLDPLSGRATYCPSSSGYRQCSWILAGSNDGTPHNGATTVPASSPQGGNFLGVDSNYYTDTLTQTVDGLVIGQSYELSFYSAGSVLLTGASLYGTVSSGWEVTLGQDVHTSVMTPAYPQNGFSPWTQTVISFTATATSELLSFRAIGSGSPPMSLLDGVSIVAVPEPGEWMMFGVGLLIVGMSRLRRRRS